MSTGLYARRALRCAAVLFLAGFAPASWSAPDEQLEQVIVTASRVPEPIEQSFWSTTVISQADIQTRQLQSMADLLADYAGITMDQAGGLGQQSSVFIRGADSDHTLLLIDGIRVGSATLGIAPFEIIPLEQIDHIEVVRGPLSTLYGSDAIGGVIQIFTRHGTEPGLTVGGSEMGGSYDTKEFTGYLSARGENAWASLSGDVLTTAGIASCLPGSASAGAACFEDNPSPFPNGHQNRSGTLNFGGKWDGLTAQVEELYITGWTAFDGSFDNMLNFTENVTALHLDQAFGSDWHAKLLVGRDVDDEQDLLGSMPVGFFNSTRWSGSLQVDGQATKWLRILAGYDYESIAVASDSEYIVSDRTTRATFLDLRGEFGPWSALAGARYEENSQFGDHITGNAGIKRTLGQHARLTVTWGTAFRAPTFDELYFPGFGNPDLQPETSKSFEVGVDGEHDALNWSLHAYQTNINNEINLDPITFLPVNVGLARIRGVEAQGDWRTNTWGIGGQLTYMEPLNKSPGPDYDNVLPRRPKDSASLTIRRFIQATSSIHGSVSVVGRWEGQRYDDLANTLSMGGYLRVDLLTSWMFAGGFTLEAKVANVLDKSYQTAAYYAQPGVNYGLTLRYRYNGK